MPSKNANCSLPVAVRVSKTCVLKLPNVPQRGRPKATEGTKRILLRESTFRLWNERKDLLNIKGLSNSQFAEILLHQNVEELRARSNSYQESTAETSNDNEAISSKISVLFIYFASKASVVLFCFSTEFDV